MTYPICPWPIFVPVFLLVASVVVFCCICWQIHLLFFSVIVLIRHLHSHWQIHSLDLAVNRLCMSTFCLCRLASVGLHSSMVLYHQSCWLILQTFCLMTWLIHHPYPLLPTNLVSFKVVYVVDHSSQLVRLFG